MSILDAKFLALEFRLNNQTREKNGYIQVFIDGKWEWQHRLIAEAKMGAPIQEGYEVHHIDGNKQNNAPENLKVLSKEEHQALHKASSVEELFKTPHLSLSERLHAKSMGRVQEMIEQMEKRRLEAEKRLLSSGYLFPIPSNHYRDPIRGGFFDDDNFYDDYDDDATYEQTCSRCGGSGYLPEYSYTQDGVCFTCGGSGRL